MSMKGYMLKRKVPFDVCHRQRGLMSIIGKKIWCVSKKNNISYLPEENIFMCEKKGGLIFNKMD